MERHGYEEILRTSNAGELALIKSLLDGEGIRYVIHGGDIAGMYPGILPARVMVAAEDVEWAREALSAFL